MKKEIPWELIISDLKQDISDADKKHLEEWVSIDENRKVYEELRGVWEKVRAKVINYTPDVDFYWKELMQRMEECEEAERRQAEDMERSEDKVEVNLKDKEQPVRLWAFPRFQRYVAAACVVVAASHVVGSDGTVTLAEAERARRQRDLVEQERDLQRKRREFQEDLGVRKNEELGQVLERANKVVKQLAEAEKYDVILQEAVYINPKHDITDKVIKAMAGQTFPAPGGFMSKMDEKNHHLHKPVFIGEVKADGQFNVVWKTPGPIKAAPWSPYIPGNDKKKDEPAK
jgi:hypothetical protein